MDTKPKITTYIDDEEKKLIEAIENEAYQVKESFLSPTRLSALQVVARATMNEERAAISLRIPKTDLSRLKVKAMREGVPYQTLINSILHKAVSTVEKVDLGK